VNKKGYPGDEAIVHSIENNDDSVLHWMYELCFPPVIKMVLQNNGNRDEASDLFQDAMVVFYENVKGGQFQLKSTISTYLYAVCRHLWLKKLREKGKSQMVYSDFDTHQEVSVEIKQFEDEELRFKKLSLAIEAIGEPCRGIKHG
jgi:RNA polymerase sigma factor (sigma-70 family)